jgi:hypothetical protein
MMFSSNSEATPDNFLGQDIQIIPTGLSKGTIFFTPYSNSEIRVMNTWARFLRNGWQRFISPVRVQVNQNIDQED